MAERSKGKSTRRSYLAKRFVDLQKIRQDLPAHLTYLRILAGLGIALVITLLLIQFQFQSIPDYQVGDIADRTIEAPIDFTVVDEDATRAKREQMLAEVPIIFDFDFKLNNQVIGELRSAFGEARRLIREERDKLGLEAGASLPPQVREQLSSRLQEVLPRLSQGRVLDVALKHNFSPELETQLIQLLLESMNYPGVILNRDLLLRYQDRAIVLRNNITEQEELLSDWTAIRDLGQARDMLRQNEYELTLVSGEDKKVMIGFLDSWIVPNVHFSRELTREREQMALAEVDPVLLQVKRGKTIVRAGDEITPGRLDQLEELKKLKRPSRLAGRIVGVFLIVCFFFFALWQYFSVHREKEENNVRHYLLLALVTTISLVLAKMVIALADVVAGSLTLPGLQNPLHFYLFAPVTLGTMLIILLVGVDLSILFSLVFAVFVGLLTGQISMTVYTLTGSLGAIYALEQYRERSAIVRAGLVIGSINILVAVALQLYSSEMVFQWSAFFVRSGGALVSGLFAAMMTVLLLPMLETVFGLITDIRLLELSNLNNRLLRRLAVEAPGTYHHSIIVGTLAEAAAEAVSANPLLLRVGAYYHDIGKLRHPEYYIENQIYCGNKHETLSPTMSSLILASHVKDGLAIAEEVNLAPRVRDLIPQHHGTRLMTYFYQKAKEAADDKNGEVNEAEFRYPGPKPQTKEAAILMLADQVEAAARTLQDPTPAQIRSLIKRLLYSTIQDGQFDESDITMRELEQVSRAFERVLTGMYHHRIQYPGFDFSKRVEGRRPESQRIQ